MLEQPIMLYNEENFLLESDQMNQLVGKRYGLLTDLGEIASCVLMITKTGGEEVTLDDIPLVEVRSKTLGKPDGTEWEIQFGKRYGYQVPTGELDEDGKLKVDKDGNPLMKSIFEALVLRPGNGSLRYGEHELTEVKPQVLPSAD